MQKRTKRAATAPTHQLTHHLTRAKNTGFFSAITLTGAALALTFTALSANAEITQDCIIEGTVDMRKAEKLGQPVYVNFKKARSGPDASCPMSRRTNSRRVQFVSSPDMHTAEGLAHGANVRYRYVERNNQPGTWELIEVKGE